MNDNLLPPSVNPNIKALGIRHVVARNEASTQTVIRVREHVLVSDEKDTDTGPTPLEMCLASLLGCEGVIINRCAQAMSFEYTGVDIEASGEVDQRGSRGVVGVRPYFNWVRLNVSVYTNEPKERLDRLSHNVEFRCPVLNLFRSANVQLDVTWRRVAK